jgi:uncharacterized membrane protein
MIDGASKRMEALSDGIFAIAATLLVLEVKVPESGASPLMLQTVQQVLPSFLGFVFSFLNILIFWVNHDNIGKVLVRFDAKLTYMNIIFLLFISLIPFTTAFISRFPSSLVSVTFYGTLLMMTSIMATIMYYYIAFKSKLMIKNITMKSRRKIWKRIISGPVLFAIAVALGFINIYIPITIYIVTPLLFLVLPVIEFESDE